MSTRPPTITRRTAVKYSLAGALSFMGHARARYDCETQTAEAAPVARTTAGRVRGYLSQGICTFKGIPYGASTGGSNRFLPPVALSAWSGIRDARDFGAMAMQEVPSPEQLQQMKASEIGQLSRGFWTAPFRTSEDCLVLNIWSPSIADERRRPVMVWLHGGGFSNGAADWGWSDGTNLARKNDVVVVSLNHRLNIFGHLYLAELGAGKYAKSGNTGTLDIAAALAWVRENIAEFGGDPGNVTVFGQSGGGCKVNVLLAMPAARGLLHRAICMSGPGTKMLTRDQATRTSLAVLRELRIRREHLDDLQYVGAQQMLRAMKRVLAAANLDPDDTWRNGTWFHMFDPVVDETVLPRHPFDPGAPSVSAHVPLLIGTVNEDSRTDAGLRAPLSFPLGTLDEGALRANLRGMGIGRAEAERLLVTFRATRPGASPTDLFSAIASELEYRRDAILIAERKSALGAAPAYMYLFAWKSPAFGGKYKSAHGFDQPFVFDNLALAPGVCTEVADRRPAALAATMSGAWVAFARHGNPNHPDLPDWAPYTAQDRSTLVFNDVCEVVKDPRRQDRLACR